MTFLRHWESGKSPKDGRIIMASHETQTCWMIFYLPYISFMICAFRKFKLCFCVNANQLKQRLETNYPMVFLEHTKFWKLIVKKKLKNWSNDLKNWQNDPSKSQIKFKTISNESFQLMISTFSTLICMKFFLFVK